MTLKWEVSWWGNGIRTIPLFQYRLVINYSQCKGLLLPILLAIYQKAIRKLEWQVLVYLSSQHMFQISPFSSIYISIYFIRHWFTVIRMCVTYARISHAARQIPWIFFSFLFPKSDPPVTTKQMESCFHLQKGKCMKSQCRAECSSQWMELLEELMVKPNALSTCYKTVNRLMMLLFRLIFLV